MSRCQNPNHQADYCTRFVLYGDIELCWICYKRIPHKLRSEAVRTGKNQGIPGIKDGRDIDANSPKSESL